MIYDECNGVKKTIWLMGHLSSGTEADFVAGMLWTFMLLDVLLHV